MGGQGLSAHSSAVPKRHPALLTDWILARFIRDRVDRLAVLLGNAPQDGLGSTGGDYDQRPPDDGEIAFETAAEALLARRELDVDAITSARMPLGGDVHKRRRAERVASYQRDGDRPEQTACPYPGASLAGVPKHLGLCASNCVYGYHRR